MANTKKTVLAIVGAIFLIVIIVIVSAVGGLAYFVRTHVHARQTTTETANEALSTARERFAGQHPMIEVRSGTRGDDDDDDRFVVHRADATAPKAELQSLRALVYDRSQHRLLQFSVPFWLLRLAPTGRLRFQRDIGDDLERSHLTIEDLERHGPGLILDTHDRNGSDVLVWVE